ncbi:MAG: hypothetical protein Q9199_002651 [Rusavskia elegans]
MPTTLRELLWLHLRRDPIPGGGLGGVNSCMDQSSKPATFWGSQTLGLSSAGDCDRLAPALKDGCLWRFGWFAGAQKPSVDFEHVKYPAAITANTGCSRNDE